MEKTLILLKPDALQRGLVGEIVSRFERAGLRLAGMKMVWPSKDHYHHHYETIGTMITRRGQQAFDVTVAMMGESPVVAVVLEGVEAADLVRKLVGATEPKAAAPGTVRGDYAHLSFAHANANNSSVPNLIHASGDAEEAKAEIAHWFRDEELFDYDTVHARHTVLKKHK